MSVAFPLLVLEKDSGDMMRFDSVGEMQKYMERIDVENEEYRAWDSVSRPIRMTVEEPLWLKLEANTAEPDSAGVFSALERFAESQGVRLEAGDHSTPPIVLYEKIVTEAPRPKRGILAKLFKSHWH